MELRIAIFLFFASVTVITNTIVIVFAYRIFAKLTARVTETINEVGQNTELREWVESLRVAAERAASVTETTKMKFAEFDPILERAHENYRQTLVDLDQKLDLTAEKITSTALTVRNVIAKPAFAVATFAAGMTKVLEPEEAEEAQE